MPCHAYYVLGILLCTVYTLPLHFTATLSKQDYYLFDRWENWDSEQLSNLPKPTAVSNRAGIELWPQTQAPSHTEVPLGNPHLLGETDMKTNHYNKETNRSTRTGVPGRALGRKWILPIVTEWMGIFQKGTGTGRWDWKGGQHQDEKGPEISIYLLIHLFIHPFIQQVLKKILLSARFILAAKDTAENKRDKDPWPHGT